MQIIEGLIQGSPQWLAIRAQYLTASEAPAALGVSKYTSRSELLKQKASGVTPEVGEAKQRLFARGHAVETPAREMAEAIIGAELYPVTCTETVEGLPLLSSMDGLTMDERIGFEHKLWSEGLAEQVRNGVLAPHYTVQMDQQLAVSGAEKILFMCSDGTPERMVWLWYAGSAEARAALIAGWKQFSADLSAYVAPAAAEPAPVGKAPETLPALRIEVTGAVTASNLAEFKQTALTAIRSVNRELKTDTDFADAEKAVKWCGEVEARLKAAKEHALSQTADIDALFKALDDIGAEARSVRLDLDKLVKRRKDEVKEEAVLAARRALAQHIATLDAELAPIRMQTPAVDFALAIKGLRSIASMQEALDNALVGGKIAADAQARVIRANRAALDAAEAGHLFPDFAQVCTKAAEDFANLIASRRAAAQARMEAERERIRAEEAARLEREQRAAAEAKAREEAAAQARADAEARSAAQREANERATREAAPVATQPAAAPAPAPEVRTLRSAPAVSEPPTMTLGQIGTRLGFAVTADFLAVLGFEAHKEKASRLYRPSDFPAICAGISAHVLALAAEQKEAA